MTPPRRIPTKKELMQMQKLYRSDERIAERLDDVPAYLVAYWRRKRNVPNYSAPKFSELDIHTLWERYGNDDRCGTELGISRAAYYNWRRRYGIKEKPAFLKLEQMEFQFPGKEYSAQRSRNYGKRSATHKLLWERQDGRTSAVGEELSLAVDLVIVSRPNSELEQAYACSGGNPLFDSSRVAIDLLPDSACPDVARSSPTNSRATIFGSRRWAQKQGIRYTTHVSRGSFAEQLFRQGALTPGRIIVCDRGAGRFVGALGSLGWEVDAKSLVDVLGSGRLTLATPSVTRVVLTGKRYAPISATDLTIHLLSQLGNGAAKTDVIEFAGPSLRAFPLADRQTLCGLSLLGGPRSALVPFDALAARVCAPLGNWSESSLAADSDAQYQESFQLNIELATPMVAWKRGTSSSASITARQPSLSLDGNPGSEIDSQTNGAPANLTFHKIDELSQAKVETVFIGGAPGGHYEQLRRAAESLRGRTIAEGVTLIVSPVCPQVYLMALKKGILRQFVESGAVITHPGADSSALSQLGLGSDSPVATTSIEADILSSARPADRYILSATSAAAAALAGRIVDPRGF